MTDAESVDETPPFIRVTLDMKPSVLAWVDGLRDQLGLRSRGSVVNALLEELMVVDPSDAADQPGSPPEDPTTRLALRTSSCHAAAPGSTSVP